MTLKLFIEFLVKTKIKINKRVCILKTNIFWFFKPYLRNSNYNTIDTGIRLY